MKEKYLMPVIKVEELEKVDVLLTSEIVQSIEENNTQTFMQFLFRGDWFND